MQTDEPTGSPLRVALLPDRPGHSSFPQAGRQKFFPSISFNVDASSIDSASSFFSLRFSSSRAFSLRASEISIPPYRDRHLENVASLTPSFRHSSLADSPAACSFSALIICSSVNLLLRMSVSRRNGLYPKSRALKGSRSRALTWPGLTLPYCMRFVGDRAL